MSKWIQFSEREPTEEERDGGLWFGSYDSRRLRPWHQGDGWYNEARARYTHFLPVTPPTDLPPKPLPELSEGSRWDRLVSYPAIIRNGWRFHLIENGTALYAKSVDPAGRIPCLPLADIEALKDVGK